MRLQIVTVLAVHLPLMMPEGGNGGLSGKIGTTGVAGSGEYHLGTLGQGNTLFGIGGGGIGRSRTDDTVSAGGGGSGYHGGGGGLR